MNTNHNHDLFIYHNSSYDKTLYTYPLFLCFYLTLRIYQKLGLKKGLNTQCSIFKPGLLGLNVGSYEMKFQYNISNHLKCIFFGRKNAGKFSNPHIFRIIFNCFCCFELFLPWFVLNVFCSRHSPSKLCKTSFLLISGVVELRERFHRRQNFHK